MKKGRIVFAKTYNEFFELQLATFRHDGDGVKNTEDLYCIA